MTQSVRIQGHAFDIPSPFAEGHQLTPHEAAAMNQLFAENVRNNGASKIKAALAKHVKAGHSAESFKLPEDVRGAVQTLADTYTFGERKARGTSEPVDPLEREAHRIADEAIRTALKKKAVKVKDLPKGKFDEMVKTHAKNEKVLAEVKRRLKAKEAVGLEDLGLGEAAGA